MQLCLNCLRSANSGFFTWKEERVFHNVQVQIGGQTGGTQRDPEYATIILCFLCTRALQTGDLSLFSARYEDARTIER